MILYKNDLIAGKHEIPDEEIHTRFSKSIFFEHWQEGWPLRRALPVFLMEELHSTYDLKDYQRLENRIRNNTNEVKQ